MQGQRPVTCILYSIQREVSTNYSKGPASIQTGNAWQLVTDKQVIDVLLAMITTTHHKASGPYAQQRQKGQSSIKQFST